MPVKLITMQLQW